MLATHIIAYLFGGATLMNAVPHLVAALMGQRFPTPFAKPPGKGLSSAVVNLLWGFTNLLLAYLLLSQVGKFNLRESIDSVPMAIGMLLIGVQLSIHFGGLNDGRGPGSA